MSPFICGCRIGGWRAKALRGRTRGSKPGSSGRPSFDAGKTGDSLAKALEARGISCSYRRGDQIPVESMARLHFLVFELNGILWRPGFACEPIQDSHPPSTRSLAAGETNRRKRHSCADHGDADGKFAKGA